MKPGLKYGAAIRTAIRARRLEPRLRLPVTYSQRHADELGTPVAVDYDKEREMILLKLIGAVERQITRGVTDESVTAIIQQWAGPVGKLLRVESVVTRAGKRTLRITATHNAAIMELRPRLKQLQAALKPTGITEVKL